MPASKKEAKEFVSRWGKRLAAVPAGSNNEQQDTQKFWVDLLINVLGVPSNSIDSFVDFERKVRGRRIDVFVSDHNFLCEQKSVGLDLDKPEPRNDGTRGSALYRVPFRLSRCPSSLWGKLFVKSWDLPPRFTTMHRPHIASVVGDEIILNGTTIEEVRDYHRDTLILCVEQANKLEAEYLEKERKRQAREEAARSAYRKNVEDVAGTIDF